MLTGARIGRSPLAEICCQLLALWRVLIGLVNQGWAEGALIGKKGSGAFARQDVKGKSGSAAPSWWLRSNSYGVSACLAGRASASRVDCIWRDLWLPFASRSCALAGGGRNVLFGLLSGDSYWGILFQRLVLVVGMRFIVAGLSYGSTDCQVGAAAGRLRIGGACGVAGLQPGRSRSRSSSSAALRRTATGSQRWHWRDISDRSPTAPLRLNNGSWPGRASSGHRVSRGGSVTGMASCFVGQGLAIGIGTRVIPVKGSAGREVAVAACELHQLSFPHHGFDQLLCGSVTDSFVNFVQGEPVAAGLVEDVPDVPIKLFLATAEKVIGRRPGI